MTQELRDKLTKTLETELEYDELYDSLYQLVVESKIEELQPLWGSYDGDEVQIYTSFFNTKYSEPNNLVEDRIKELQSQLSSIGESK